MKGGFILNCVCVNLCECACVCVCKWYDTTCAKDWYCFEDITCLPNDALLYRKQKWYNLLTWMLRGDDGQLPYPRLQPGFNSISHPGCRQLLSLTDWARFPPKKLICKDVVTELGGAPCLCKLSWRCQTQGGWTWESLLKDRVRWKIWTGETRGELPGWKAIMSCTRRSEGITCECEATRAGGKLGAAGPTDPQGTRRGGPGSHGDQTFEVGGT